VYATVSIDKRIATIVIVTLFSASLTAIIGSLKVKHIIEIDIQRQQLNIVLEKPNSSSLILRFTARFALGLKALTLMGLKATLSWRLVSYRDKKLFCMFYTKFGLRKKSVLDNLRKIASKSKRVPTE
jgi:hypothetical protein